MQHGKDLRKRGKRLYAWAATLANGSEFYTLSGLPDNPESRFESLTLHLFVVLYHLDKQKDEDVSQAVVDSFFAHLDISLRELGVGDLSVGRKVKALGRCFYGRIAAYDAALTTEDVSRSLRAALERNLYADAPLREELVSGCISYFRKIFVLAGEHVQDVSSSET